MTIIVCGPGPKPEIGSRVSLNSWLDDGGFGSCAVFVKGLYGEKEDRFFCSFSCFGSSVWKPNELPRRQLRWLEKRIKGWDDVWPGAAWVIRIAHTWQGQEWRRVKPGRWEVTSVDDGIA